MFHKYLVKAKEDDKNKAFNFKKYFTPAQRVQAMLLAS